VIDDCSERRVLPVRVAAKVALVEREVIQPHEPVVHVRVRLLGGRAERALEAVEQLDGRHVGRRPSGVAERVDGRAEQPAFPPSIRAGLATLPAAFGVAQHVGTRVLEEMLELARDARDLCVGAEPLDDPGEGCVRVLRPHSAVGAQRAHLVLRLDPRSGLSLAFGLLKPGRR
jgi:hypothetical protein